MGGRDERVSRSVSQSGRPEVRENIFREPLYLFGVTLLHEMDHSTRRSCLAEPLQRLYDVRRVPSRYERGSKFIRHDVLHLGYPADSLFCDEHVLERLADLLGSLKSEHSERVRLC